MARSDRGPLLLLGVAIGLFLLLAAAFPGERRMPIRTADLGAPVIAEVNGRITLVAPAGMEVRYTTDGSEPGPWSARWTSTTVLAPDERNAQRLIRTPSSPQWRTPKPGPMADAVALRCRLCDGDGRCGPVVGHTSIRTPSDLPVLALTLDAGGFMDPDTGIYVVGHGIFRDAELAVQRYPRDQKWWKYPGNYQFRGKQWERTAGLELFDDHHERQWAGDVKVRINGNNTRGFPQHALRVSFKEPLDVPVFGAEHGSGFRGLVLRSGGNDQDHAFLRDALQHRLCGDMPFFTSAYRPCVLLVNGAYWGLHDLRERLDDREVARRIGVPRKRITILADQAILYDGDERDIARFTRLLGRAEKWDASAPAFTDSLERYLDLEGFLQYMAAQLILGNADWPDQNVKYWRYTGDPDTVPGPRDGRWRFMMGDSDQGFGDPLGADFDHFARVLSKATPVPRLFKACLRSRAVRVRFRAIVLDQLAGALSPERMDRAVVGMSNDLLPVMPRHIERWRRPVTIEAWRHHVDRLRSFAADRGAHVRRQLDEHFPVGARS
jgi:hypothetical protein